MARILLNLSPHKHEDIALYFASPAILILKVRIYMLILYTVALLESNVLDPEKEEF